MRLQDGQVMDYTKDSAPYLDDRFSIPTGNNTVTPGAIQVVAPDRESEASTESCMVQQGPIWITTPNTAPLQPQQPIQVPLQPQISDPWPGIPTYPSLPLMPQPPVAPAPYYPSPLSVGTSDDRCSKVFEKVLARKEALEALSDQTPETRAIIKALEWVLSTITNATVTFGNGG